MNDDIKHLLEQIQPCTRYYNVVVDEAFPWCCREIYVGTEGDILLLNKYNQEEFYKSFKGFIAGSYIKVLSSGTLGSTTALNIVARA